LAAIERALAGIEMTGQHKKLLEAIRRGLNILSSIEDEGEVNVEEQVTIQEALHALMSERLCTLLIAKVAKMDNLDPLKIEKGDQIFSAQNLKLRRERETTSGLPNRNCIKKSADLL
jgi:hypothetical protein